MCRDMVTTNAQYLGLPFFQATMIAPEGHGLLCSTTGKIKHVKRQDDMLLAAILAQANIPLAH